MSQSLLSSIYPLPPSATSIIPSLLNSHKKKLQSVGIIHFFSIVYWYNIHFFLVCRYNTYFFTVGWYNTYFLNSLLVQSVGIIHIFSNNYILVTFLNPLETNYFNELCYQLYRIPWQRLFIEYHGGGYFRKTK